MAQNEPAHPKTKPRKRGCLKSFFLTGIIAALTLAIAAWFARGWITQKAEAALQAELKKRELHVTYDATQFSLLHGLVLKDVTLFRDAAHSQPFLKLSNLALAADLTGQISALITTDNATFTIYTGKTEPTFTALNARVRAASGIIEVSQFESHFQGLDCVSSARITFDQSQPAQEAASSGTKPSKTKIDFSQIDLSPFDRLVEFVSFESTKNPPRLTLDIDHNLAKQSRRITGNLSGDNFVWRGIPIDSLDLPFLHATRSASDSISFEKVTLSHNGQPLSLIGRLDLTSDTLLIEQLSSNADILSIVAQAVPQSAPALKKIKLTAPPSLTATGTLPFKSPRDADLTFIVAGENTLEIDANGKPLVFQNLAGIFALKEGTLSTENLTADLFGGTLKAKTSLRPFDTPLALNTSTVSLDNASVHEVESFLGTKKGIGGTLTAHFTGSGPPTLHEFNGSGHLQTHDTEFYTIPIYGNLADIFGKLLPKFNKSDKSTLTADLTLNQGTLSTQNLKIHSSGTTIDSKANVNFPKRYLTAQAEAHLGGDGLVGAATGLLGKALQIEAQGSFDHIQWKFDNIPGLDSFQDMASLTGKLGDGTINLLTRSAGIILDAGNVSGDAVKAGADLLKDSAGAVKDLGKGLLKGFGGNKDK